MTHPGPYLTNRQMKQLRHIQALGQMINPGNKTLASLEALGLVKHELLEGFQFTTQWTLTDAGRGYSMAFGNVMKGPIRR